MRKSLRRLARRYREALVWFAASGLVAVLLAAGGKTRVRS
jgi:hypothetical protein